jgi:TM2 domain-containing membrane protein YozV
MSTTPNKVASATKQSNQGFVYLPLIAGWLIPGAGHFLLGKWVRGTLLAVSIIAMFVLGLAMHGTLYTGGREILEYLSVAGDMGSGLLYLIGRGMGLGAQPIQTTVADYGTKFIVVAGMLNIIAAVDAHNLRTGRKQL